MGLVVNETQVPSSILDMVLGGHLPLIVVSPIEDLADLVEAIEEKEQGTDGHIPHQELGDIGNIVEVGLGEEATDGSGGEGEGRIPFDIGLGILVDEQETNQEDGDDQVVLDEEYPDSDDNAGRY